MAAVAQPGRRDGELQVGLRVHRRLGDRADPPEVKHHDVETFRRQFDETRENLGDWLDLYQIHSATPDSGVLENDAC